MQMQSEPRTFFMGSPSDTIRLAHLAEPTESPGEHRAIFLGDQIGSGGVGEVFEAVQPSLDRTVAVKLLKASNKPSLGRMFENEAYITARLNHPNILPVHDMIRIHDVPALVMKRVHGQSWAEQIEAERRADTFKLENHLEVLVRVCRAVAYAHEQGVLHLDIKPGNVMVGEFGETLLMDWGCAAIYDESHWNDDGRLPRAAAINKPMGTPLFMAPEQAKGDGATIGPCTDVYLLGATLRALLNDGPLRVGTTVEELLGEAASGGWSELPKDAPAALVTLVERALQSSPTARTLTIQQLTDGLTAWLNSREAYGLVGEAQRALELCAAKNGVLDDDEQRGLVQALGLFEQAAGNPMVRDDAVRGAQAARVRLAQSALDARSPGLARVFIGPLPDDHTERADLLRRVDEQAKQLAAQRKAQRRVRWLVAATAIVVVVAAATSTNLYLSTERALVAEVAASEKASAMYEFSSTILSSVDPEIAAGKDTELLEQILEGSVDRAYETFSDQPESLQMVHGTITTGLYNLGRYNAAIPLHERLLSTLESMQPVPEIAIAKERTLYSSTLNSAGRPDESIEQGRLAAQTFAQLNMPLQQAEALFRVAAALEDSGKPAEALEAINTAIRVNPKTEDSQALLMGSWAVKARVLRSLKEHERSIELFEKLIEATTNLQPDSVMELSSLHLNLGLSFKDLYRYDEALVHYNKALELREQILEPTHPRLLTLRNNIGSLYLGEGALDEAQKHLTFAYQGRLEKLGSTHPWTTGTALLLTLVFTLQDDFEAARELYDAQRFDTLPDSPVLKWLQKDLLLRLLIRESKTKQALDVADDLLNNPLKELDTERTTIWRAEAQTMLKMEVNAAHLISEAFPPIADRKGHGNCVTIGYARSVVRTLRGLGRHAEATSFQRDFIERANQELAESTSPWNHNTRACLARFEAIPPQQ